MFAATGSVTNPVRIPSACLISPPPPIDRTIKKPHPLRSPLRATHPSTTNITGPDTTTAAALSISSNVLKTRRSRRRATITHSNPKKPERWPVIRVPEDDAEADPEKTVAQRSIGHSRHGEPRPARRPLSFSSLLPLLIRVPPIDPQIYPHSPPSSSPPATTSSSVIPIIQSNHKTASSQPSSPSNVLSFPKAPLVSPFIFHFSIPTPACHLPPPHPGPPSRSSDPPHSRHPPPPPQSRPSFHGSQTYPIWPSVSSSTLNSSFGSSKSRIALPPENHIRAKKIKLSHSFFRSSRIFHPVDRYPAQRLVLSCSSNSLVMSSSLKKEFAPEWLHTSPAVGGYSSNLRPKEQHWTGNPHNWCIAQESTRYSTFRSPPPPLAPSSFTSPKTSPLSALPQPLLRPSSPCSSQAAPLKAQLLAVLRMRSSLQPGEAALKLKKWVIWNSWVRGQAQSRLYPVAGSSHPGLPALNSSQLCASSTVESTGDHDWTGDEMFDDDGNLISGHEFDRTSDGDDEDEAAEEDSIALNPIDPSPLTPRSTEETPIKRSQTLIRLKLPARVSIPKCPQHPTPPASPASLQRSSDGRDEDDSKAKEMSKHDREYPTLDRTTKLVEQSSLLPKVHPQTPATPPPSPRHDKTARRE